LVATIFSNIFSAFSTLENGNFKDP
jgi:hypothetical protein